MQAVGGSYLAIKADLATIQPVERILDETTAWAKRADILVNNAGILRRADPLEFSEKDWDDVINVDLKSVFFLAQAFANCSGARRGREDYQCCVHPRAGRRPPRAVAIRN